MSRVNEILNEANERLKIAKCGLDMILASQGEGRIGVRNVAVFGRMVTFATNNLRSIVDDFENWDVKAKQRHFDNDECRYMTQLRNVIEKQARTPVSMSAHIRSFNTNDMNKFPRPPGATSFFIGDHNGGTGWMIMDADKNETPYYVALPPEIGKVWFTLPENEGKNVEDVASKYVACLENYLAEVTAFAGRA